MSRKFIRFFVVLLIVAGFASSTDAARAGQGAMSTVGAQNLEPLTNPVGVQFVHTVTAASITGGLGQGTIIDHPLANGHPEAVILVTHNWNPGMRGGVDNDHPIGLWYSGDTWRIFNQDLAAMPVGTTFNVMILTAGANAFVHTTTAGNSNSNVTAINNALTNNSPNAVIFVTPNWNPGGICGCVYNNHPIGVDYASGQWRIFLQDGSAMPINASFNVFVTTAGPGVFVHNATADNTIGYYTTISSPLTNANEYALVFITPNGTGGMLNAHNTDVSFGPIYGNNWLIENPDFAAMPIGAAFNVLVLAPTWDIFVHTATSGNTAGNVTTIDNPLTNDNPNTIAFLTQNWNPGGSSGTYNNHNIGVYYYSGRLRVFNQDMAAMPVSAAFNVLVPNPDTRVFVHKATASNTSGDYTIIDNVLTNDNPYAVPFATPNWNPGGVGGMYNDHPIGVYYTGGRWRILNQDFEAIPLSASFNVFVASDYVAPGSNVFIHTAAAGNIAGNSTIINHPLTNDNPFAIVVVIPNNSEGIVHDHPVGVYYTGGRWRIFNEDLVAMQEHAAFNVYIYANKIYLPLLIR